MDGLRPYSTIGIEGFIDGPTHPLPSSYLSRSSSSSSSPPFISWEITGVVKDKPEDFVVREILPKNNIKIAKIVSHYNSTRNTNDKNGGDVAVNENNNNNNNNDDDAFLIACIPTVSPIELPPDCQESKASPLKSETAIDQEGKELPKEKLSGEQQQQILSLTTTTTTISTTSCINSNPSSFSSSGENATASSTTTISSEPLTEEEIIQIYLEHVATLEHPATVLRQSLEELEARVINRIPLSHDNIVGTSSNSEGVADDSIHNTEVWIPPFRLLKEDNDNLGLKFRTNRRDFHRAISIKFPFLKTVSSIRHVSPMSTTTTKNNTTTITTKDTTDSTNTNDRVTSTNTNTSTNDEHWIKVTVEDCFDGMIEHLNAPRDDLRRLLLFRNRGFDGASTISSTLLRLRSDVSKDDRRTVHHIISLKNRNFESSMRHQGSSKQDDSSLKSIVVTWKRQALAKDARKNNKRKHNSRNDGGGSDNSKHRNNDKNLLCVLKKTQKEHLTAMQILSRILKCRQSDIGFAGIKDMQAITYQFITLRDMGQQHVERNINQLGEQNVELKIIYSNVDFALNVGDLKGNFFEIMVRNLKRIKVDQHSHPDGETDASESLEESFVECDSMHINQMVERIKKHGFINFYGEQRIGHPGSSEQVGVRGFQIGQAMLRKDYMEAIKMLMEGTRHRENDDVRRVRQAWKESNGDPSTTIKAFGNADIMPRERAVLRGLKRYPNNPLESLRFLSHQMRMFYINAYQSYIFNRVASQRIKLYGDTVIKGDIYFDTDGDHCRDSIKIVNCNEVPPVEITQVVLPLPGYDVQYPGNDIGQLYKDLLLTDNIRFEKNSVPESTAKGSYRKLIVHPGKLSADIVSSNSSSASMKLSFELPKGCYATMLLRELMVTTVIRSNC